MGTLPQHDPMVEILEEFLEMHNGHYDGREISNTDLLSKLNEVADARRMKNIYGLNAVRGLASAFSQIKSNITNYITIDSTSRRSRKTFYKISKVIDNTEVSQ